MILEQQKTFAFDVADQSEEIAYNEFSTEMEIGFHFQNLGQK
jgi:hypothetical protein